MSTKFTPKKTTIGYSVAAIMAGVVANPVQAIVDIDSVAQYDNAITNAKYQEIANRQANDEKVKMRLYDVLHHLGNSSNLDATSKQYIRDNLPSADVLANGSTFQLYNGASSAVGSTVASERTIRLGAGSKINTVGGQLDVDNVANITLGGKTYNFAGSTTEGVVSVGDKTTDTQRTITNVAAGRINATSTDAINGSQLHATNEALKANITQTNTNKTEIAKGINFIDDNGNKANIKQGGTLGLSKADTNVTVDIDSATNKAKIGLADNINAKSVTTGTASMSTTGINAGSMKVTNVADGAVNATSKDAVNGSQLHATNTKVNQNATNIAKGINFGDGNGNTTKINLGGQFNIEAGSTNVTTKVTNGKVTVDAARDQNLNSTTYGGVKISTTGLNNGGNKVTNVADGAINATSKDAVNGSQLHATNTKVNQNTTNIAKNAAEIAKGINFTDDNGNKVNIKQGGTLGLSKADTNVTVDIDTATNKAKIGLADNINVQTVTTGAASMSTTGINAGNMKVTNVADGAVNATSKDAVNGSQLHATNTKVNQNTTNIAKNAAEIAKGINFTDDNGNTANIKQGGTLGLSKADNNVTVDIDSATNKARIGLADDINVKTVTADSVTTGTASMSTTGINAGSMKVTNVADGAVNATSKDAINGSQLHNAIKNINTKIGNVVVYDGNTQDQVTLKGPNGTKITNLKDGDVNATSKDAVNGSQLHATNTKVNQNTTNIAKNAAEIAKGINFTDDNGNTANIKQGGTLGLSKADTNVTVDIDSATNKAKIGLADNINVKTVTADSVTTGAASMSTTGINAGNMKVTNVADGAVNATSKDAVNGSQLHATNTKVNQNTTNIAKNAAEIAKGINFTDDNGNTANIKQGGTLGLSKADTNVTVDIDSATNKAKIGLADNINVKTVTADSVTTGAASMSTTGINAGSMKVTNVADGAINANSTDAVNGSQLHATNIKVNQNTTNIAKGINFGDGNGNVTNVQLGNQFNVEAGSTNVTTKVTNGKVTVDVARNQNLDSTTYGGVKISTTGLNNGGNKVINVADGNVNATSKDAVNGSQLYAVKQLIQNSGSTNFNVAADTGNPTHISTNDTLNINGGKNIQTTITSTGAVQVGLKDDINVKSITVNGGGSITQNGINAGGNRITNVAEGVDGTDAVNVNQLNRVSQNINKIASDASSGTAAAMAVGTLGQAWEPGSSTVSVAGSVYDGKAGWAIGGSNMTDNGKWLIKYNVSGSGNSKFGAAASVTYQY